MTMTMTMTMTDKDIFSWVAVLIIFIWTVGRLIINHRSQSKERFFFFMVYVGTVCSLLAYQFFVI